MKDVVSISKIRNYTERYVEDQTNLEMNGFIFYKLCSRGVTFSSWTLYIASIFIQYSCSPWRWMVRIENARTFQMKFYKQLYQQQTHHHLHDVEGVWVDDLGLTNTLYRYYRWYRCFWVKLCEIEYVAWWWFLHEGNFRVKNTDQEC